MKELIEIGMFFAYWIATIVGCFLTLFIVRFLVHFDIASAINVPTDRLGEVAVVFTIIGLFVGLFVTFKNKK